MKANIFKYFIVSFAAMSIACSCGKNSLETHPTETSPAIGFSNISTKAATITELQTEGFGVWTFMDNAVVGTNQPIMENTKVTYETGSWKYSPLRYWIDESVFTFLAAYPYLAANTDDENGVKYTIDPNIPALNINLSKTPAKKDFMIATNVTDTSDDDFSPTVDLQFKHILTSVRLRIWRDHGKHQNDQMRIRQVTLSNIRKAGTYSSSTDSWTPSDEMLTLEEVYEGGTDEDNIGAAQVNDNGTLETITRLLPAEPFSDVMLIPQTLDESNSVSLRILYELKRQNAADWEQIELVTVLPDLTWEANSRYTYNVVLSSVTDITVYYIQTKVDPWGTPQVGGTVIIK